MFKLRIAAAEYFVIDYFKDENYNIKLKMLFYLILDRFFLYFHAGVTLFGALGWISKRTRKLNLFVLVVTTFSWLVLGIWYGWGYCILTDIHWNIKEKLGHFNIPRSYVKYLVDEITGLDFDAQLVDMVTVIWFCIALICSILLNIYDFRKSRQTILNK